MAKIRDRKKTLKNDLDAVSLALEISPFEFENYFGFRYSDFDIFL